MDTINLAKIYWLKLKLALKNHISLNLDQFFFSSFTNGAFNFLKFKNYILEVVVKFV